MNNNQGEETYEGHPITPLSAEDYLRKQISKNNRLQIDDKTQQTYRPLFFTKPA